MTPAKEAKNGGGASQYTLEFRLDVLPKSPNALLGAHWTVRSNHAKRFYQLVGMRIGSNLPEAPLRKARVTMTRVSAGRMDADNLRSSFKPIVDALVKHGVLLDDSMEVIGEPVVLKETCGPRKGHVVIKVEEINQTKGMG